MLSIDGRFGWPRRGAWVEDRDYGQGYLQMLLVSLPNVERAIVTDTGQQETSFRNDSTTLEGGVPLQPTGYTYAATYPPLVDMGANASIHKDADDVATHFQDTELPVDFDAEERMQYYIGVLQVINFYYVPVLVLFGSIGNVLSVLVFFKTKLRNLSSSYYLAALGLSDTCYLVTLFAPWVNMIDIKLYQLEVWCQFFTFFNFLCCFLSVWLVVAFTVERFIAVMYPLKRQTMCTVRRAKVVILALTAIGIFLNMPIVFYAKPQFYPRANDTICGMPEEYKDQMTAFNYLDTILVFVVPFTAIVVLNTFTALTVWKFAGVRRAMTMTRGHGTNVRESRRQPNQPGGQPFGNGVVPVQQVQLYGGRGRVANSQIKVTKMLLIVSTVFVCLNLPSYVVRVKIYLKTDHTTLMLLVQSCCHLFFITNFGINFILYCVSGQNFRKAVLGMFRKRRLTMMNLEHNSGTQITEYVNRANGSKMRRNTTTITETADTWRDLTEYEMTNFIK